MAVEIKDYTIKYENSKHYISVNHDGRVFFEVSDRDPNNPHNLDLKNYMLKSIECQILKYCVGNINLGDGEIEEDSKTPEPEKE